MLNSAAILAPSARPSAKNFWASYLTSSELRNCADLEKLLAGCEIIAALDAVDLLAT
jgi:hypothetical protein